MKKLIQLLTTMSLAISLTSNAQMNDEIAQVQTQWAIINYQTNADDKVKAFEQLAKTATQLVLKDSQNAHALTWEGIVYSTYAGVASTFKAGGLAKQAKKSFERAIEIDGTVLNGSAYTSLGVLYYKVPGWPLSFGSDKKALQNLKKGLEYNPDGIDSNYFYAEFLYEEEDDQTLAKQHLLKAQNAPARPNRPVADAGRQKEITALLNKINK